MVDVGDKGGHTTVIGTYAVKNLRERISATRRLIKAPPKAWLM